MVKAYSEHSGFVGEVMLNAFMPIENYENNKLIDSQHPSIHIKGYLNEVKELNHFEEGWGS
ncbi:MAG: hypothetical protein VB084_09125 [Syntrophomonadaceae bacterium]|nr:hypothetical protein [Syntrophomonadaceae bacterium]